MIHFLLHLKELKFSIFRLSRFLWKILIIKVCWITVIYKTRNMGEGAYKNVIMGQMGKGVVENWKIKRHMTIKQSVLK